MKFKPSYLAILESIRKNKINISSIFLLDFLQVFCESGLLATTYLLLGFIQNSSNIYANTAVPYSNKILKYLVNVGLEPRIGLFLLIMIVFAIIQSISKYICQLNIQKIGAWMQEKINLDIAKVVLESDYEINGDLRTGQLLSIAFESPEAIKNQLEIIACSLINILLFLVYSQILISLSIREFFISLSAIFLVGSIQIFTSKRVKSQSKFTSITKANVNNSLAELIKGIKYLKASGSTLFARKRLKNSTISLKKDLIKEAIFFEITSPLSKLIGVLIIVFVVYIFSISISKSEVLLPTIGVFIVTLQRLIGKISEMGQLYNNFNLNKGRTNLYDELIIYHSNNSLKKITKNSDPLYSSKKKIKIEEILFSNVHYKFPKSKRYCLSNINFKASKGDIIGIIGRSGSGKSTILNLISGLIKPTKGSIMINGKNIIKENNFAFNNISIVSQESYVIYGSIFENIVWDQRADRKKVMKVLDEIDNLGFIKNLKDGIDTKIGEGGRAISGGQTQLICLARAFYKEADILILDESTNALDSKCEDNILKVIRNRSINKITFIVTHNIENLKICSKIYQLSERSLFVQNNYNQLIKHSDKD